jgi:hypothetical protein
LVVVVMVVVFSPPLQCIKGQPMRRTGQNLVTKLWAELWDVTNAAVTNAIVDLWEVLKFLRRLSTPIRIGTMYNIVEGTCRRWPPRS